MWRVAILVFLAAQTASFRPAVDNEAQLAPPDALNASDTSDCDLQTLEIFDPETLVQQGIFRPLCGSATPLEVAVQRGWSDSVEALFQAPELANGMAALRLRLQVLARHLPHWPKDKVSEEKHGHLEKRKVATPANPDGLDVLRRVVPPELRPKDQEIIGDMPYNWLTFYQIKVMCLNAQNKNSTSQRAMEVILASQGFDSFARNFSLNVILLSLIFFSFGLMVYVSFRLRAFGWLEVPVSLAELVPGAFPPERLADAEFDPSRQKKQQLPYRRVPANFSRSQPGFSGIVSNGFQAIFGIYTSWLLLCIRIPPEKDAFDEEYMTDDDEECRLKVRDVCAMRAKNVGSIEVIVRALSLCGLHYYLICAGRYSDLFFLDFLYITYAWLVCTVASSVPETVEVDAEVTEFPSDDPATTVTAVFGVQHGPRWLRAQCTTRSTAAPNKAKRRLRRRRDQGSGNEGRKVGREGRTEKDQDDTKEDTKDVKDDKDDKDDKGEETEEKEKEERDQEKREEVEDTLPKAAEAEKMADGPIFQGPEKDEPRDHVEIHSSTYSSFSDRFQRLLLNAGILHINHSSLLELTVVSMCSCFLAVVFLLHLRWTATGSLTNRFYHTEAMNLIQTYGLPESFDRALALAAEMLVMWFSFERLYDMSTLLHAATLTFKQRNAALRFLREHQPPWTFAGRDAVTLQQAKDYCEEVVRCSDFALELSDARWRMLQKPVEFLVSLVEVLLLAAFLLILVPMLLPFLPNFQIPVRWHGSTSANFGCWAFLDPVVPLTLALVLVSPTVHMLLQAHFANSEIQRQQSILRSRAEFALCRSPLKQEEDVEYVQLRNSSRKAFAKALLKWNHGRVLGVVEPIIVLYSALLVVGLAAISRLNFIII